MAWWANNKHVPKEKLTLGIGFHNYSTILANYPNAWAVDSVGGGTYLQLLGVPHPSPAKARQFVEIDLRSATESITAAAAAGIDHLVYVSVAQPAPGMLAYQQARARAELTLSQSGLRRTILRP